jgi:hypothetical protein
MQEPTTFSGPTGEMDNRSAEELAGAIQRVVDLRWRAVSAHGFGSSPLVSIVIPTLDEEAELPALLDALAALPGRWELVVADGGSTDATVAIARGPPARPEVVARTGDRAAQLNAGAQAARGDVLLFLRADSPLPHGAYASLAQAWRTAGICGGNFALRFDGDGTCERVLGAVYRLQRRHGFYLACTPCYHAKEANRVRTDGDHTDSGVRARRPGSRGRSSPGSRRRRATARASPPTAARVTRPGRSAR